MWFPVSKVTLPLEIANHNALCLTELGKLRAFQSLV